VQFCTVFVLVLGDTVAIDIPELDAAFDGASGKKLTFSLHNAKNALAYRGRRAHNGYVTRGDERIEIKKANS
jgi:hypothetical protein